MGLQALHRKKIRSALIKTAAAVTLISAIGTFTVMSDAKSGIKTPTEMLGSPPPVEKMGETVAIPIPTPTPTPVPLMGRPAFVPNSERPIEEPQPKKIPCPIAPKE